MVDTQFLFNYFKKYTMKKYLLTISFLSLFTMYSSFSFSQSALWGMTYQGGIYNDGVIFKYDPLNNTCTKIMDFDGTNTGGGPTGNLLFASDHKFYGMTAEGGNMGYGSLFEYNPVTGFFSKNVDFSSSNGIMPFGNLIEADNGKLYGMTFTGGQYGHGVLFEYEKINNIYAVKLNFSVTVNGMSTPCGSLLQASDGKLYGTTFSGNYYGTLFDYNISIDTCNVLIDFYGPGNGGYPQGSLIQASNGKLYGLTSGGGVNDHGTLFEYDPASGILTKKADFTDSITGSYPVGALMQALDRKLYGMASSGGTYNFGVLFEYDILADTLINRYNFDGTNGRRSYGTLSEASNGKFYGMTMCGGLHDLGVIFEYDPATNIYTKKFDFDSIQGSHPFSTSLVEVPDSSLTVSESPAPIANILIYPDPAFEVINISGKENKILTIEIYAAFGELLFCSAPYSNNISIDLSRYAEGIYFLKINTINKKISKTIIKLNH
jgi:uncharacterized repeat protein (TIGR03803 family)